MSESILKRHVPTWVGFLVILLVCIGMLCIGVIFRAAIEFFVCLVLGWVIVLSRSAQLMTMNLSGMATALACLVGVVIGCQFFCAWLYANLRRSNEPTPKPRWQWRWTIQAVGVVLLMFVAGIGAVGVSHQSGWLLSSPEPLTLNDGGIRQAAIRARSQHNLEQQGLAALSYGEVEKDHLPPGVLADAKGRLLHGWQVHLLPFIEQDQLYRSIDLHRPWNDPVNDSAFREEVKPFQHPSVTQHKDEAGYALTHYAANVHVLGGDVSRTLKDFDQQGQSNVILIGEINAEYLPWGKPGNWREPALGLNRSPKGFGSPIKSAVCFGLLDGSVRTFTSDADPDFLRFLSGQSTPDQEQLERKLLGGTPEPKQ